MELEDGSDKTVLSYCEMLHLSLNEDLQENLEAVANIIGYDEDKLDILKKSYGVMGKSTVLYHMLFDWRDELGDARKAKVLMKEVFAQMRYKYDWDPVNHQLLIEEESDDDDVFMYTDESEDSDYSGEEDMETAESQEEKKEEERGRSGDKRGGTTAGADKSQTTRDGYWNWESTYSQ